MTHYNRIPKFKKKTLRWSKTITNPKSGLKL